MLVCTWSIQRKTKQSENIFLWDLKRLCFSATKPSVGFFLLAKKKRSGLLFKSVGATAGNHNLRPLSNHTNYSSCVRVCACHCLNLVTICVDTHGSRSHTCAHAVRVSTLCVCVGVSALFVCMYVCCSRSCNHCHARPSVLAGRLVRWLVPALPFSQVLLPCT